MNKEEKLEAITHLLGGMVEKDEAKMERAMAKEGHLIHMNGLKESREEYIRDILDGALNYYEYEIISLEGDSLTVRLLAKVYGGSKSWWNLRMDMEFIMEEGRCLIHDCKVRMA